MVKLEARLENENVIISRDSFEHLLNCLANQKFIGDFNADAIEEGEEEYDRIKAENQDAIDGFYCQCRDLLNETSNVTTQENNHDSSSI